MLHSLHTSAVRVFGRGSFQYFAPVTKPRHIGARQKGVAFGLMCQPKQKTPPFCHGSIQLKLYSTLFCPGCGRTEAIYLKTFN